MATPVVAPAWAAKVNAILLLKDRSWSWLAQKIGIDATILSKLKNGRSHGLVDDLDQQQREAVSQTLEVPMSLIFGE